MHAVAIGSSMGDIEAAVASVTALLGRSHVEVRQRLAQAGEDPLVLGALREHDAADVVAQRLVACGFEASVHDVRDPLAPRLVARTFVIADDNLEVVSRDDQRWVVDWVDVDVVVLAARPAVDAVEPTRNVPVHPLAAKVARVGMRVNPSAGTPTTSPTQADEHIAVLFAGERAVVLREHTLVYRSLGAAVLPSRGANYRLVVQMLRERCARATWDDRLLRAPTRGHVLGGMALLDPHLELASAIVAAASRRGRRTPYR